MTGPVVVLVGPPGAGKSSIGSAAAGLLGVPFRDTDDDVAEAAGASIAEIFVNDGEATFRAAERAAVAAALVEHEGVLALGGGAVLDTDTRSLLARHTVVFLDVSLSAAVDRVGLARDRPLLLGSPRSQLKKLMDARRPLYEQVSIVTLDTSDHSVDQLAAAVAEIVQGRRDG